MYICCQLLYVNLRIVVKYLEFTALYKEIMNIQNRIVLVT